MSLRYKHFEAIEKHAGLLGVLIAIMVSLGGWREITPLFVDAHTVEARARRSNRTTRCDSPAGTSTCARAAICAIRR